MVYELPINILIKLTGDSADREALGITFSNAFFIILGMFVVTRRLEV
jgi:hypothetical protein